MVSDFEYVGNTSDSNTSGDQSEMLEKSVNLTELSVEISAIGLSPPDFRDTAAKSAPMNSVELVNAQVQLCDTDTVETTAESITDSVADPGGRKATAVEPDSKNVVQVEKSDEVSVSQGERDVGSGGFDRSKSVIFPTVKFLMPLCILWFSVKSLSYANIVSAAFISKVVYSFSSLFLKLFTTKTSDLLFELMSICALGVLIFLLAVTCERSYTDYKKRTRHYRMGTYVIYTECDCHEHGFINGQADANHLCWRNSDELNHCEMLKCLYMSKNGVYLIENGKFALQVSYNPQKVAKFDPSTRLGRSLNLIF